MAAHPTPILTRRPKTLLKIERRAWLRLPTEQDVICHPVTSGPQRTPELAWLGKVRDVSLGGIGLTINRRFEPGIELIVELSVKPRGVLNIPVRVVHATSDKKGLWIIGCEFIFPLSEEERQSLIWE
jgi:c-di-GMP-binding flagellar brake protein YcgR